MRQFALVGLFVFTLQGRDGLPARSTAESYTAKAEAKNVVVAAELMPPEQVRSEFSTTLIPDYVVIEVALYPENSSSIDVVSLDFGLRVDGRLIRHATPRSIAVRNQRKSLDRKKEITLWPSVGVSTGGGYGTGTSTGVGVGIGDAPPGPASTDRDRSVMEAELEERGLQDGRVDKPVAGYLYFPLGDTKSTSVDLVYEHEAGEVKMPLTLPKK